jgi:hypothetical protein
MNRLVVEQEITQLIGRFITLYTQTCRAKPTVAVTKFYRQQFVEALIQNLHWIAPMIKHWSFENENEHRIIHHTMNANPQTIEFLPKATMMSAYINLDLHMIVDGKKLLPITRIIVGPSRYKDISATAVRALLLKCGYPPRVGVDESVSPYRVA